LHIDQTAQKDSSIFRGKDIGNYYIVLAERELKLKLKSFSAQEQQTNLQLWPAQPKHRQPQQSQKQVC
jgi:hypothetical protein